MKKLILDNKEYTSRLILGTGKYKDFEETQSAIEASGCEMVTVAIRRMNIGQDRNSKNLLDYISPKNTQFYLIPLGVLMHKMLLGLATLLLKYLMEKN